MKYRLCFVILVLFALCVFACKNPSNSTTTQENRNPPPPPLTFDIDAESTCSGLKEFQPDRSFAGAVYLIYDSIDLHHRILFEYLLHKDYGLSMRPVAGKLDTLCIRPFYDAVIESRYQKTRNEMMTEIHRKASDLRKQIGENQIEKGLYYLVDTYPSYLNGTANLYFTVKALQDSLGSEIDTTGYVMFYFTVDKTGSVGDVEIYKHLGREADSISALIIRSLPDKWIPATLNGKTVNCWMQYAIEWHS